MIAGYEKEKNAYLRYSHTRLSGVSGRTEILPPFGRQNNKTTFCYRRVLQRKAKRVNDLFCYRRVLQQQVKRCTPTPPPVNWHLPSGRGGVQLMPCGPLKDERANDLANIELHIRCCRQTLNNTR